MAVGSINEVKTNADPATNSEAITTSDPISPLRVIVDGGRSIDGNCANLDFGKVDFSS